MDAHVFRAISRMLADSLYRARLERIHQPVPGVTAFSVYTAGKKQCLLLRAHRSAPLLFLMDRSPLPNPAFPPASIMRLRKYAEGRILGAARINWIERQIAFPLPGPDHEAAAWLLVDCKHGTAIVFQLQENFSDPPSWPDADDINAPNPWERFQTLTPLLRKTLESMDAKDAAALLVDLESGGGDLFWYGESAAPRSLCAWPLPHAPETWEKITPPDAAVVFPLLQSMQLPLLLADAEHVVHAPEIKRDKSAQKKQKRLLDKLDQEKKRLETMLLLGEDARILQENLWKFSADERRESVALPVDSQHPEGDTKTIALNPFITIAENMQIMFRKAAKAVRGLGMLEKRMELARSAPAPTLSPSAKNAPQQIPPKRAKKALFSPSLIQEFISSDGFVMWRGRNAEGNKALLKLARPFDWWCHVEDGPSAHLLIRRDHAAHEAPDPTLREAAVLVGLKSWRKDDPKAPVMFALAKHVQPVKGAGPGTVRVQEVARTLVVALDTTIESSLKNDSRK